MNTDGFRLLAVGDMSFGDHPLCRGFGVGSTFRRHGPEFPFAGLAGLIGSDAPPDFLFGNLECSLAHPDGVEAGPFQADVSVAQGLRSAGFNILNLANNHSMQNGRNPFDFTAEALTDVGINPVGLRGDDGDSCRPVIREKSGARFGFLGFSFIGEAHTRDGRGYATPDPARAIREVAALRTKVDFLIVSCHWGLELARHPSPGIVGLGRALVDHGADVVLGHHPHVWQGVERHGAGLIFYSLGDFIFDLAWCGACRQTGIAEIMLSPEAPPQWRVHPMTMDGSHRPLPTNDPGARLFAADLADGSRSLAEIPSAPPGLDYPETYLAEVQAALKANQVRKWGHVARNFFRLGPGYLGGMVLRKIRP